MVSARAHYILVREAPHYIEYFRMSEEETFSLFEPEGHIGVRTHDLRLSKQAALATAPRPQPLLVIQTDVYVF